MRLIGVKTRILREFGDGDAPPYAILSHTWAKKGEDPEVTFTDINRPSRAGKMPGYKKIAYAWMQAQKDKLEWAWIDTCCIDKSSSSELQTAINSMWLYRKRSKHCYVFLQDYPASHYNVSDGTIGERALRDLADCKWFTRGWTVQEMIAPYKVNFYGPTWQFVGTKHDLARTISTIARVNRAILLDNMKISSATVAQKLSWAAERKTTCLEDVAYSLLGILGVRMPLLYGEDRTRWRDFRMRF